MRKQPPVGGRQALAAGFADLVPLLAEAGDDDVIRTGTVLRHLELGDVDPAVTTARLAVLGTSTTGPLQAPLLGALASRGIAGRVTLGDHDGMIAELLTPDSPSLADDPTAVVLLPDGDAVFRYAPVPFTTDSAVAALDETVDQLLDAIRAFRARSSTPVIVPTLLLPPERSALLLDLPGRARLSAAWHRANARLLDATETVPGLIAVDLGQIASYAPATATDPRLAAYTRTLFTEPLLLGYARQVAAAVAALQGRTAKCLVLDLDGTTWGGVLADDGPRGVVSGEGRLGEAFAWVQDAARQLSAQGVVLAIASKNDGAAVRAALAEHPGVRVSEQDFAVVAADWNPKPGNIAGIAATLGIGLESLVFVDDNPSERGAVRAHHPHVRTVAADPDDPSLTVPALLRDGAFTTLRITDEDRHRPARYRAEADRTSFRQSVGAVEDYLAGLRTEVVVAAAEDTDVDRLSQLTLRTNQYNLTTHRMDSDAVRAFACRPNTLVTTVRCTDRFGDHGLVGALFAEIAGGEFRIVNFAMSCRVLGRGVESAVLRAALAEGAQRGARVAVGTFVRTAKNERAVGFFAASGFAVDGDDETTRIGGRTVFRRTLATLPDPIPHLTVNTERQTP
ncbi:HAD-IIIC family phosphatase [Rhodococcus rhodnii]|nr:HAD-IIIC family phosphatase [Rhodococcus rhodnii]